jgi:hypothetical protein
VAHVAALLLPPYSANSYTTPYFAGVSLAGAIYFLIGLSALYFYLRREVSQSIALFTLAVLTFGTNLFHYATLDACFSHIYAFSLMSLLVLVASRLVPGRYALWALGGLLLGLLVLVRHTDILLSVYLIPFIVRPGIVSWRRLATATSVFLFTVSPQILYYWLSTGHPIVSVYGIRGEGFSNLAHPQVLQILFLPQAHGMFFWSPLLALAAIALFHGAIVGRDRRDLAGVVVFMLITLLIASWLDPGLGAGFGHRGFIELYPIFALPLARFIQNTWSNGVKRLLLCEFLAVSVLFNTLSMLAYWHGLLPYSGASAHDAVRAVLSPFNVMPAAQPIQLEQPLPDPGYQTKMEMIDPPLKMRAGEQRTVSVRVLNLGTATLLGSGGNPVRLSYQWTSPSGETDGYNYRKDLPIPLGPGDSVVMSVNLRAPDKTGLYRLDLDLVQELVAWFRNKGGLPYSTKISVVGP